MGKLEEVRKRPSREYPHGVVVGYVYYNGPDILARVESAEVVAKRDDHELQPRESVVQLPFERWRIDTAAVATAADVEDMMRQLKAKAVG